MVDGVADGLADALVLEFGVRAVEGEDELVAAVGRGHRVCAGIQ